MRLGLRALPPLTPAPLPGVPGRGERGIFMRELLSAEFWSEESFMREAPIGGVLERGIFMRELLSKEHWGQGILFREPIQFACCGSLR